MMGILLDLKYRYASQEAIPGVAVSTKIVKELQII